MTYATRFLAPRFPATRLPTPRFLALAGTFVSVVCLAGCFEVASDTKFTETGEAVAVIELALTEEFKKTLEGMAKPEGADQENPFDACGKPLPDAERPPYIRTATSKSGERAGMWTCTITMDISDPIAAFVDAKTNADAAAKGAEAEGMAAPPDFKFERLPNGDGYRLQAAFTPPKKPEAAGKPASDSAAMEGMMLLMFKDRFFTVKLSGQRIENTTGELGDGGKSVTWKIPFTSMMGPDAKPVDIKADIYYK